MVYIKYIDEYGQEKSLKFLMKSEESEINLVRRFNDKLVKPSQILNLGQLGSLRVENIKSMTRVNSQETVHKNNVHGTTILENTLGQFTQIFKKD